MMTVIIVEAEKMAFDLESVEWGVVYFAYPQMLNMSTFKFSSLAPFRFILRLIYRFKMCIRHMRL